MPDPTVEALAPLKVLSTNGDEVELGSLWAEKPVLLALIRHFG